MCSFLKPKRVYGLPEFVPYDRILVSAAATELPTQLLEQLKIGGRMVVPTRTTIHVIDKVTNQNYTHSEYPGYVFVPLV